MNIIYYYTYLFFKRFFNEKLAQERAAMFIGFTLSFTLMPVVFFLKDYFLKNNDTVFKLICIALSLGTVFLSQNYFLKNGKSLAIIAKKPIFFNNHILTVFLTILYYLAIFAFIAGGLGFAKKYSNY